MTLLFDRFDSPIGVLTIAGDERGLSHVLFPENRHPARGREDWHYAPDALPEARDQLLQFLHGERNSFDLVLAPRGTPFQLRVWQALALIPFGQTWSYLQLAQHLGQHIDFDPAGRAEYLGGQLALATEVAIQAARGDTGIFGQCLHGQGRKTAVADPRQSTVENALAQLLIAIKAFAGGSISQELNLRS